MRNLQLVIMRLVGLSHNNLYNFPKHSFLMEKRNASEIKQKILRTFRMRGPCLPVHISKEINMSILFTSAFLSELLSEKELKLSHMNVGSTPVYLIPGQEPQLEKYTEHFKGKEKEAYLLIKQSKFLQDSEQQPAIRVALRAIKDFAIPFKKDEEIFWRYFTIPQEEFNIPKETEPESNPPIEEPHKPEEKPTPPLTTTPSEESNEPSKEISPQATTPHNEESEKINFEVKSIPKKPLNIFDKKPKKKSPTKKSTTSTASQRAQDKFFNTIKEHLAKQQIEISDIIAFSKTDITLKVKKDQEELLLIAYKKRITESEIINAHKKAQEMNLRYIILGKGEPLRKTTSFIDAIKDLEELGKVE